MNTGAPVNFSVSTTNGEDLFTSRQTPAAESAEEIPNIEIHLEQEVALGQEMDIEEPVQSPEVTRQEYFPFLEKIDFIEEIKRRRV
jgi:hypothetical protein